MVDVKTTRLDKYLSNRGVTSRRNIKKLLKSHTVTVNGTRVFELGIRITPETDDLRINGNKLPYSKHVYFMLNKPIGIVSTSSDEYGRTNVVSLIDTSVRIFPVGRLDKDTSGLILLTNDGDLTHKLTHPKYHVPKIYHLTIQGMITDEQKKAFADGVLLRDGITQPVHIAVLKIGKISLLRIVLHEGRYRQIRRMCETLGIELIHLKRIAFGPIKLGSLKEGEYRNLTKHEIASLEKAVEKS